MGVLGGAEFASTAATPRGHAAEAGKPAPFTPLEELFAAALARLADETGADRVAAWTLDADPALSPTAVGDVTCDPPGTAALDALFQRAGAVDLGEPGLDRALANFGRKAGFAAAVPLGGESLVTGIFLGEGPRDQAGKVRPRTLAALDQLADRLRGPATTAVSVARLVGVEQQLMRLTRLATLGDLLTEAVHEIRNPLVSVKTFLQLLPDNLDDPDFHTNFREQVVDEVRRMERLLDSILAQARPDARPPELELRTAIGEVLESVGRLLEKRAQEKQLRLVVDVGADLPPAAIDEDALRQIVLNLALNAFEATPEAGHVRLTVERANGQPGIVLTVDDEGPGIPEPERERLFEPFFSSRAGRPGGLGLTVCRRLVDAAGGSIHVESAPHGGGARFRVRLPGCERR